MEIAKRHLARHSSGFAVYIAVERRLIERHIARGGTAEDFCIRLAPLFRRRFGALLALGPDRDRWRAA